MTDDQERSIVQPAADDARDRRTHLVVFLAVGVSLVSALVLALLYFGQSGQLTSQAQQIAALRDSGNDTAQKSQLLAQQVRSMGGTPVVQPATPAPAGPTGPQGPAPTQAQIDEAVAAYLVAHPPAAGQNATPAMVATAVAEYLTAHPPEPGRPPTPQEIATAAASWFASHAAEFKGADGAPATDAQVKAAVDTYCSAHANCAGKTGPTGPAGPTGAQGPRGPAGPTCPDGYELRDAVITAPDGSTYQGKACVDPSTSKPPGPIPLRK